MLPLAMKKLPHVLIDLPASIVSNRRMLLGILRYAQLHGPWLMQIVGYDAHLSSRNTLSGRQYDGAIVDLESGSSMCILGEHDLPVAQIVSHAGGLRSVRPGRSRRVVVSADNPGIGQAAAEYLSSRGFQNFAFLGIDRPWSRDRGRGFQERLRRAGHIAGLHELPANRRSSRQLQKLRKWIEALPKPVALFVANDPLARQVNNILLQAGLAMPEDVAILGVDDDPVFCESTTPPTSSVQLDTEACGFEVARALDQMMAGKQNVSPITYGFAGVKERMSTSVSDCRDPLVTAASRILADRITHGNDPSVSARSLARAANASRRLLEIRFKAETGRTVHEEITRLRFARAQVLLQDMNRAIAEVARDSGFATASHFSVMFKRTFGITPSRYRHADRLVRACLSYQNPSDGIDDDAAARPVSPSA